MQSKKNPSKSNDSEMGISLKEYAERRKQLGSKMPESSIAILPSGNLQFRNHDTEYPFRQDSYFYYLTGFSEPEAVLVLKKEKANDLEYILFCRANHPEAEVWTGPRMGIEGAYKKLGVDKAYAIEEIDTVMPQLLENKKRIDLLPLIAEERLIKSPAEIKLMKKAANISAEAHIRLMETCQPNQKEYTLEAEFLHECYQAGCRAVAYSSIVAGGKNACVLHYTQNNQTLKNGDLVLVDAGVEYQNYASDITRTFPVNGRFSEDQKKIYQIVLEAQLAAIALIRPGMRFDKMQEIIVLTIVKGLVKFDILKGEIDDLIQKNAHKQFYMHSSGHWLGLDVHDVGEYKIDNEWRVLEPGMVLTVEPGIYIAPNNPAVDKRWWGIGVRIEDDIWVTDKEPGHEVLTQVVPKTIEAIETLMLRI